MINYNYNIETINNYNIETINNTEIINYENDLLKDLNYNQDENINNNITININDFYKVDDNIYNLNNGIDHIIKQIYLEININDYYELVNSESKDLLYSFLDTELYINESDCQILSSTVLSSIYVEIINTGKDIIFIDEKVKIYLYNDYYNKIILTNDNECTLSIEYLSNISYLFENVYIVYNTFQQNENVNTNYIKYISSDHILYYDINTSIYNKIIIKNGSLDICSIIGNSPANGLNDSIYINDVDICNENKSLNSITKIITIMDNDFYLITHIENMTDYINTIINSPKKEINNNFGKYNYTDTVLTINNNQPFFVHNIFINI